MAVCYCKGPCGNPKCSFGLVKPIELRPDWRERTANLRPMFEGLKAYWWINEEELVRAEGNQV